MNTTTEPVKAPAARMSGGEVESPLKEIHARLRRLITDEADVHRLICLEPLDSVWIYLIETPFADFPRYVIGFTDDNNTEPTVVFQCGAEWSAQDEWNRIISQP